MNYNFFHGIRGLILLLHFLKIIDCNPKVFPFRGLNNGIDSVNSNYYVATSSNFLVKSYKSGNDIDYFRLLDYGSDYILIGGADSIYNISIETFKNFSIYNWTPHVSDFEDCKMKSLDQVACHNYIRVVGHSMNGNIIICGTNAYRPMCRTLESNFGKTMSEFLGVGLSPMDPRQNTTFYMEKEFLYAATVTDFSGTDSLIFRRNITAFEDRGLRTQRNNDMLLNKPQFVGILHSDKYVYFFFREEANEALSISTHSRVARVCKSDYGGPRNYYEAEWTTFVKARLNCSIPEKNKAFYFDEIISISNLVKSSNNKQIFYATFVSEFNFLRHSVICAFDLAEIDKLFANSDILVSSVDLGTNVWARKKRIDLTSKLVGQCQMDSKKISENDAIELRKSILMADSVSNVFSRGAIGIHRGSDNYNQIAVLQDVKFMEGTADILYVATDQGNIIKMVNLAHIFDLNAKNRSDNFLHRENEDPVVPVAIYEVSQAPIRSLLILGNEYLVVVTDSVIYRLPLYTCSMHETCDVCISSRDPHCVWHENKCSHFDLLTKKKNVYQDVLAIRGNLCNQINKDKDQTLQSYRKNAQDASLLINVSANARHNINYTSFYGNNKIYACNCNKSNEQSFSNCDCLQGLENLKNVNKSYELESEPNLVSADDTNGSSFFLAKIGSIFPGIKNANGGTLPWWVSLIIILALVQTLGFFYLCFKLYAARKRRKNSSLSSSIIVSSKIKGLETNNATAPQFYANDSNTSNYALYPSSTLSSNYMTSSGLINAYSPAALLNFKNRENCQNYTSQKKNNKSKYFADDKLSNYMDSTAVYHQGKKSCASLQNYGENYGQVSHKLSSNYREADEHAAALAIASMSLTRPMSRASNFDPNIYRNTNNFDCRITGSKISRVPTLKRENLVGFNHDRNNGESPVASDLSTMSSSSASTNVTTLSFFQGDCDKKNKLRSTLHENLASGEEISIEFEGATSTPAFQTFGIHAINPTLIHSQKNKPYYEQKFLQNQNQQTEIQKSLNGMIISA